VRELLTLPKKGRRQEIEQLGIEESEALGGPISILSGAQATLVGW
jgi:hypothetical protein